jgi:secondary thiamine-phosphate synthase enzyme
MRQASHRIHVETRHQGLVEITSPIVDWVRVQRMSSGLLTVFCRHSSASLVIQENASPDVRRDLEAFFAKLVPEGRGLYRHEEEGPDDMPAHIRSALTQTHVSIPIEGARLLLGTWQGVYLFEHRRAPHRREIALHLLGED